MERLQNILTELASLFGYTYDNSFFDYLKSISIPNTTICGKEIKEGDGCWKCKDCELNSYSIYCNDCFIKEKHFGHDIYFNQSASGFCDCGENLDLKPEGFCDKHRGENTNMEDLMDYIKSSIDERLLDNINNIFNRIFLLFIDNIKNYEENEDEIYEMFDYLEKFGDILMQNNLSLFYLFALKFTENFPYETNHKCFSYDENKHLVTFIKKDKDNKHTCICPFMQVMIYVLMKRNTKQNSLSFFNLFLQTYKNKIITSLCFLNSFSELFYNKNLQNFREMGYQLVNENLSVLVYQDQNIPFLELCFEEIYSVNDYFFKNKNYENLESISYRLYQLLICLPNKAIINKMNYNIKIIKIIINICCLINNANTFENKTKFNVFQKDRFENFLFYTELYYSKIVLNLIHIVDFDNKEVINSIFNILFEKLKKDKEYKESLPNKIFSPHLTSIKCYSVFLNRFCFNYSIKHECDLFDSFNLFLNIFPQAKELNGFIFEELINFFSFMISNHYSFFIYYGESMLSYYMNYFNINYNLIKFDISLMKYLITQPEIKSKFNLKNILSISDINTSNKFLQDLLNDKININDIESISNKEEKNIKFNNSVLEFLYLIIRDNSSMVKIAFRNINFKLKTNDEIHEKLYQNEKDKMKSIVKNEIINFILSKENSVKRDECFEYVTKNFDSNYKELVNEILKNNCEKIVLSNGLVKFSLKKDVLNLCDIDYIISAKSRKNIIEYITNFQSNNFNLSNINMIEPLNIEKKLTKNIYQTFYNEKNIDNLIKLYNLIYTNKEKTKLLNQILYSNLTKIFTFAYKLCSTDLLDEDFKMNLLQKMNIIEDKQFQKEKISEAKVKKSMKEKLKKKFDKKNEILKEKLYPLTDNIEKEKDNQDLQEICVYCREYLYKDSNGMEYYGKICYYFSDYMTDIMNKKPEDKRKKSRKFVSCHHKIHIQCFVNNIIKINKGEFECPFCKKLGNIILCDFSYLIRNNDEKIQGLDYTDEPIDFDNFYQANEGDSMQGLVNSNVLFFENYCSKLVHDKIGIEIINEDKTLFEIILKLIIEDFEEFTVYFSITSDKRGQIEIWKNILYNLRFLFKFKILTIPDIIHETFNDILNITRFENFVELLLSKDFNDIINTFIIISFILFDSNEDNREIIKNIFVNKIILYYIYFAFIKSNNNYNIDIFVTNNKIEIIKALELFCLKYKICLLLFNENENNTNININLDQIIGFIKLYPDFNYLADSVKKNKYIEYIKKQYLEIPSFNLINLPENGIDFLYKTNKLSCLYCNKKYLYSYLCLICGNKLCNKNSCLVEKGIKKGKEFSLIYHSKKCCGGNAIFLNIINAEIIYLLKRKIIRSNIFIYMNDFGEIFSEDYLKDEYKLNKRELEKAVMKYIDMTFRKKMNNIYFVNDNY